MKILSILLISILITSCVQTQKSLPNKPEGILIINSDESVEKYSIIQQEFETELSEIKITGINLAESSLQDNLVNPLLVYAIGSKAYSQASKVFKNKPLIFSSMINWRRFDITSYTYGVALELPVEMQLFMYSYLFPDIHTLGVLYSKSHNSQWFELAVSQAKEVGLSLYGKAVANTADVSKELKEILPKVDALWLISDPTVLHDANQVQQIFDTTAAMKKPIFAYSTLFTKYGAILTIAADLPTMGRQAAYLAQNILEQQIDEEKIQLPAGSHVTLNLKRIQEYGIKINHSALSSVENIIK
ncbi:ABC transporter substrate binding protein [Candidatus Halobeggiatoa sp. HSG11]|nr:ABC transporter substrate binding protein [Candidatus Halobeggiatoa sp. HSG11]